MSLYVLTLHVRLRWLVRSKLITVGTTLEPLAKKCPSQMKKRTGTVPKPCSQTCVPHDMDMHSWKLGCLSNYVAQKYGNTDRRHPPILTSMYKNALPFDNFWMMCLDHVTTNSFSCMFSICQRQDIPSKCRRKIPTSRCAKLSKASSNLKIPELNAFGYITPWKKTHPTFAFPKC